MLSFFRSIRRSLISEGKTVKYMKYAVGEVLLVVIGILIALSVNNWNEERKLEQDKRELIENLKTDFRTNLMRLEEIIPVATNRLESSKRFLGIAGRESSHLSVDELRTMAKEAYDGFRFRPTLPNYEAAVGTGSIALIASPELNRLFVEFQQSDDYFQESTNLSMQDALLGGGFQNRQELGSWGILRPTKLYNPPEAFNLSDQEYRNFIAQKDVYATFENMLVFHFMKGEALVEMKGYTEQILAALEALD